MRETFGVALRRFANSIDTVRDDVFEAALQAANRYLELNFNITRVERLGEVVRSGVPSLAPAFSDDLQHEFYPVRDEAGGPNGLAATAFVTKRKIWVTPGDGEEGAHLANAERYAEHWYPDEEIELAAILKLPQPEGAAISAIPRTLIAIPIVRRDSATALVYFESPDVLQPSDRAKEELEAIATSLARLYLRREADRETHQATRREIDSLDEASRVASDWGAARSMFWAYADSGDRAVLACLDSTLRNRASEGAFQLEDWQQNHSGGRIPAEIEEKIRSATYFVAYLSQPSRAPEGEPQFADNPNVLYEAGVFQGLAEDPTTRGKNWLLIREGDSVEAPFDIKTVNTLVVDRDGGGELLTREFEQRLEKRLDELIGTTGESP